MRPYLPSAVLVGYFLMVVIADFPGWGLFAPLIASVIAAVLELRRRYHGHRWGHGH